VLTALASATSISVALYVGAVVLAAAAPLYLVNDKVTVIHEGVSAESAVGYEQRT
jgi:hypothetical protein